MLLGVDNRSGLEALHAIETLPADTPEQVVAKEQAWRHFLEDSAHSPLAHAADALVGAYLLPKTEDTADAVPTSITLHALLTAPERAQTEHAAPIAAARAACEQARVFHWRSRKAASTACWATRLGSASSCKRKNSSPPATATWRKPATKPNAPSASSGSAKACWRATCTPTWPMRCMRTRPKNASTVSSSPPAARRRQSACSPM